MAKNETHYYVFGGWVTQRLYDENDMAEALNITRDQLIGTLSFGREGGEVIDGLGLSYHAHPLATGDGYRFHVDAYMDNLFRKALWDAGWRRVTPDAGKYGWVIHPDGGMIYIYNTAHQNQWEADGTLPPTDHVDK